ncbi:MAG: c-type cytochrome [Bryobacterales bacterium]|nr:c-type cytochrome [Bryobacterales bacterium]
MLVSCSGTSEKAAVKEAAGVARPIGKPVNIESPLGLPPLPMPADNPPTAETIALGKALFFDKKVSVDNTLACSNCHDPRFGFADPNRFSTGFSGKKGGRNAPTVINAAYSPLQFWDGRAPTLEEQAAGPIANPVEMNHPHDACSEKLQKDQGYQAMFEKAFGPGPVTMDKVKKAVAAYERTLLSGNSPFDRYQYGGDTKALSPAAIRGLAIFQDAKRGNCAVCHTIEEKYALFTDGKFHNIGVGLNAEGELTDLGRYAETKNDADKGAFKTPTLRNIAQTAPYMHDGSQKTLRDVVDFYVGGGSSNPHLDKEIKELKLSGAERADLVAFLESLTGEVKP